MSMKVIVVTQLRKYNNGETRYVEIECNFVDDAAKICKPYFITNPKQGPPYEVVGKYPISVRDVHEITQPLDDYPGA